MQKPQDRRPQTTALSSASLASSSWLLGMVAACRGLLASLSRAPAFAPTPTKIKIKKTFYCHFIIKRPHQSPLSVPPLSHMRAFSLSLSLSLSLARSLASTCSVRCLYTCACAFFTAQLEGGQAWLQRLLPGSLHLGA